MTKKIALAVLVIVTMGNLVGSVEVGDISFVCETEVNEKH